MKLRILYLQLLVSLVLCTSCESWLNTEPNDKFSQEPLLSTLSGNESLIIGAYDIMQSSYYYGCDLVCIPEILADNCTQVNGGYNYTADYYNRIGSGCNIWTRAYALISLVNDVIDAIDKVAVETAVETKTRDRLKGEALFLRGLAYFDLLRSYAREPEQLVNGFDLGVPLITNPFKMQGSTLPPDAFPSRNNIYDGWIQVEKDLGDAFTLLDNNDGSNFPQRANSYAAKALLARAYLYQSKWADAAGAAGWVISQHKVDLNSGAYINVFTEGSESIFELRFTLQEALGAASLQSAYSRTDDGKNTDTGSGYGELLVGNNIRTSFEPGDARTTGIRSVRQKDTGDDIWYTAKFSGWQGSYGQDNIPLVRIAEMYLIRAEASLKLPKPDYTTARNDIDAIRTTRGLTATAASNAGLLAAAEKERRLELCFEGHRFFDLKRQGKDITKEGGQASIPYTDFRVVAGIPQTDMDVNKKLVNNPGYN